MLALRVALRYLFSPKSHNAVNILSIISVAGVAVATAAMVIVLSVFNGFSDLAAGKLSHMDPDLLVAPAKGKILNSADSLTGLLATIDGIDTASPVLREKALAVTPEGQMPVTLLGMTGEALHHTDMSGIIIDGTDLFGTVSDPAMPSYGRHTALLSVGVAVETGLRGGLNNSIRLYVPRRLGRINAANPMNAFRGDTLAVSGVYRVEQAEYDTDMVVVPLEVARRLLEYPDHQASAIQIFTAPDADTDAVARKVSALMGDSVQVLDRIAQQQQAFNMIAIEKWVTLLMLALILVITSFNIISAIYILRVEKSGNMSVLRAMGATPSMIRSIFAWQGRLITLSGGVIGIILGSALTLMQQWGGVIKLQAGDLSMLSVEAYPVRLAPADITIVALIVTTVALVSARIATLTDK